MTPRQWFFRVMLTLFCCLPLAAQACFEEAAEQHDVPVDVLKAIAKIESGGNPNAVARSKNGTMYIGLMQIGTGWLPTLAKFGITREKLKDRCTNVQTAAWILASYVARYGDLWAAVEAYHSGFPRKAQLYSKRVQRLMPPSALAQE